MTLLTLTALGADTGARPAALPELTVPQSCSVQLKENNKDAANLDQIREVGFKYVRRGFLWSAVEKKPGVYDFTPYDTLVTNAHARGLSVLATIALGNPLYAPVHEEAGRAAYARYAAALVEHFKNDAILWELWNEPNTMTFWGRHGKKGNTEPYAAEYVALVNAAIKAMRAADPKCYIVGGSVSGLWKDSYEWQTFCFQKGILKSGIDAWSVHPYSTKNPEDYDEAYARVRRMMAEIGGVTNMAILNTERGFPIGKAEGHAGGDPKLSAEYQAWHFVRQYMVDLLHDIRLTSWYEWSGKEGFSLLNGPAGPGGKHMPAYEAAAVMIGQLNGYRLAGRVPLDAARDFVLRFVNPSGAVTWVAWTAPPPGESPDKIVPHEVMIPVSATGALATVGLYGEKGTVAVQDGKVKLALTGAPQYIVLPGSAERIP